MCACVHSMPKKRFFSPSLGMTGSFPTWMQIKVPKIRMGCVSACMSIQYAKGEVLLTKPGRNWQLPSTDGDKSPQSQNGISVYICVCAHIHSMPKERSFSLNLAMIGNFPARMQIKVRKRGIVYLHACVWTHLAAGNSGRRRAGGAPSCPHIQEASATCSVLTQPHPLIHTHLLPPTQP